MIELLVVVSLFVILPLFVAIFLFVRKKRTEAQNTPQIAVSSMSKAKSAFLLVIEATLSVSFFFYLVLKDEIIMPAIVGWIATLGLVSAIGMEIYRRK